MYCTCSDNLILKMIDIHDEGIPWHSSDMNKGFTYVAPPPEFYFPTHFRAEHWTFSPFTNNQHKHKILNPGQLRTKQSSICSGVVLFTERKKIIVCILRLPVGSYFMAQSPVELPVYSTFLFLLLFFLFQFLCGLRLTSSLFS